MRERVRLQLRTVSISDLWNDVKSSNICAIGILGRKSWGRGKVDRKKVFEELRAAFLQI